jgi:hypothetical protein
MKTEFLHEVVRRRERNARPSVITQAYNDMMAQMEESYRRMYSVDARAREAIDRYMSQATANPTVGMNMVMPVLDINAPAGTLGTANITYQWTGDIVQGYRGWVRIS